jgi:hypothetical protein
MASAIQVNSGANRRGARAESCMKLITIRYEIAIESVRVVIAECETGSS